MNFSVGGHGMKTNLFFAAAAAGLSVALLLSPASAADKALRGPIATASADSTEITGSIEPKQDIARPFSAMVGTWQGDGTITVAGGGQEKLRCRARHTVTNADKDLILNFRCASDSFKFEITSKVVANLREFSGSWLETSTGVTGTINGQIDDNRLAGIAEGAGYSADIAMVTASNRQSVTITPHNAIIKGVQIGLSKR